MLNRLSIWPEAALSVMFNKKAQNLSPYLGSRLCVFTSGSFAFFHFQLHYINLCLFFTSGTIEWKVEHRCISVHFGSCLGITDRAVNPSGILLIFTHKITSSIAFALRGNVGLYRQLFLILERAALRSEVEPSKYFSRNASNNASWIFSFGIRD